MLVHVLSGPGHWAECNDQDTWSSFLTGTSSCIPGMASKSTGTRTRVSGRCWQRLALSPRAVLLSPYNSSTNGLPPGLTVITVSAEEEAEMRRLLDFQEVVSKWVFKVIPEARTLARSPFCRSPGLALDGRWLETVVHVRCVCASQKKATEPDATL